MFLIAPAIKAAINKIINPFIFTLHFEIAILADITRSFRHSSQFSRPGNVTSLQSFPSFPPFPESSANWIRSPSDVTLPTQSLFLARIHTHNFLFLFFRQKRPRFFTRPRRLRVNIDSRTLNPSQCSPPDPQDISPTVALGIAFLPRIPAPVDKPLPSRPSAVQYTS